MYEDPFKDLHLLRHDPRTALPLAVLVHAAVDGLIEHDGRPEHAHELFEKLNERVDDPWRETGLLLTRFVLSRNVRYGEGPAAAAAYEARLVWVPEYPSLNLVHKLISAFIAGGEIQARALLRTVPDEVVHGAVRYLLCLAVGNGGLANERTQELFETLCVDAEVR
ncbi:hypothetical protein [Saccharothrix sp. HUAS TT1]|uniref:hypothetical protein n=1 Tax=unclassified Saccharothrix TaxID=2593673 RepID=UPI00345BAE6B